MKRFARLFLELDETTHTGTKLDALVRYFESVPAEDSAWAVYLLVGERPKRLVPVRRLAAWAMAEAAIEPWLFDECYAAVGDLAETVTLLFPEPTDGADLPLHRWMEERLLPLHTSSLEARKKAIVRAWAELSEGGRLVWNKLITGGFRLRVPRKLLVQALAHTSGVEESVIAQRLAGTWEPTAEAYRSLVSAAAPVAAASRPYPFLLAHVLEGDPATLGDPAEWQAEWMWSGVRAQLMRRSEQALLWTREEEGVGERFPELLAVAAWLPDGTVLDGEIVAWREGGALPFSLLQRRTGRKRPPARLLAEVPVVFIAFDLLERWGADLRPKPLRIRRKQLVELLEELPEGARARLILSPVLPAGDWLELHRARAEARTVGAEGLMLKRVDSRYGAGRPCGPWWKWKAPPHTVDAVLLYAQAGDRGRGSPDAEYTFALWHEGELVPFARTHRGLGEAEGRRLASWVRRNTREKFGPVRAVRPEQVFEIAFEGVERSSRHRSGVSVRSPRILSWRPDKSAADAHHLTHLHALLEADGG